jgi:hypothetical protein
MTTTLYAIDQETTKLVFWEIDSLNETLKAELERIESADLKVHRASIEVIASAVHTPEKISGNLNFKFSHFNTTQSNFEINLNSNQDSGLLQISGEIIESIDTTLDRLFALTMSKGIYENTPLSWLRVKYNIRLELDDHKNSIAYLSKGVSYRS